MTSDTEQPEPDAPQTKATGAKPKASPSAQKRPSKRRPASKKRQAPDAYDQGFRSGPRVWPD